MKLQISTDYAIRILQYLHTTHMGKEPHQTAMGITIATGLTYPFFTKLVNQLKKKELVKAIQGRNGGYMLAKPIEQISVYDVFLATGGEMQLRRCLVEGVCRKRDAVEHCGLRGFFCDMQEDMIARMSAQSIGDLKF